MKFEQVIELIKAVSDSELTTFKYEEGDTKIVMKSGETPVVMHQAMPASECAVPQMVVSGNAVPQTVTAEVVEEVQEVQTGEVVVSPLVGTFYSAPSEGANPYVKVGDTVKKGQVLGIVEAMKLMNEIESDFDGVVTEVLVENATGVEYGQGLFRIG